MKLFAPSNGSNEYMRVEESNGNDVNDSATSSKNKNISSRRLSNSRFRDRNRRFANKNEGKIPTKKRNVTLAATLTESSSDDVSVPFQNKLTIDHTQDEQAPPENVEQEPAQNKEPQEEEEQLPQKKQLLRRRRQQPNVIREKSEKRNKNVSKSQVENSTSMPENDTDIAQSMENPGEIFANLKSSENDEKKEEDEFKTEAGAEEVERLLLEGAKIDVQESNQFPKQPPPSHFDLAHSADIVVEISELERDYETIEIDANNSDHLNPRKRHSTPPSPKDDNAVEIEYPQMTISAAKNLHAELKVKPVVHVALPLPKSYQSIDPVDSPPKPILLNGKPDPQGKSSTELPSNHFVDRNTKSFDKPISGQDGSRRKPESSSSPLQSVDSMTTNLTSETTGIASRQNSLLDDTSNIEDESEASDDEGDKNKAGLDSRYRRDNRSYDEDLTPKSSYSYISEFEEDDTVKFLKMALNELAYCSGLMPEGDKTKLKGTPPGTKAKKFFHYMFNNCGE